MGIENLINDKIDDIFRFYNQENGDLGKDIAGKLLKHRYLIYSSVLSYTWEIAYGGVLVAHLVEPEHYNAVKVAAMVVTAPAIPLSSFYYGAFWSKLGSRELLEKSWQENKARTIGKVLLGNPLGSVLHNYYKLHLASDIVMNVIDSGLKKACEKSKVAARAINIAADISAKISEFYIRNIMPWIT